MDLLVLPFPTLCPRKQTNAGSWHNPRAVGQETLTLTEEKR